MKNLLVVIFLCGMCLDAFASHFRGEIFSSLTSKNEVRLTPVVVDLLQVYFQKTTNKREPNPQPNRSDERRKGGEIYFPTSHRLGPAARFLASLGVCRGLFGNRLVASHVKIVL